MSFGDIFKAKENNELKARIAEMESMLTLEAQEHLQLKHQIEKQRVELDVL